MSTITRHATINGREYRAITTLYDGGIVSVTVVQVRVVFDGDNGAVWRALPWWAVKRIQQVLETAR